MEDQGEIEKLSVSDVEGRESQPVFDSDYFAIDENQARGDRIRKVPKYLEQTAAVISARDHIFRAKALTAKKKKVVSSASTSNGKTNENKAVKALAVHALPKPIVLTAKQREEVDREDALIRLEHDREKRRAPKREIIAMPKEGDPPHHYSDMKEAIIDSLNDPRSYALDWSHPGMKLIGYECRVFFDEDGVWYPSRILNYDFQSDKHFIFYPSDNTTEWLRLVDECVFVSNGLVRLDESARCSYMAMRFWSSEKAIPLQAKFGGKRRRRGVYVAYFDEKQHYGVENEDSLSELTENVIEQMLQSGQRKMLSMVAKVREEQETVKSIRNDVVTLARAHALSVLRGYAWLGARVCTDTRDLFERNGRASKGPSISKQLGSVVNYCPATEEYLVVFDDPHLESVWTQIGPKTELLLGPEEVQCARLCKTLDMVKLRLRRSVLRVGQQEQRECDQSEVEAGTSVDRLCRERLCTICLQGSDLYSAAVGSDSSSSLCSFSVSSSSSTAFSLGSDTFDFNHLPPAIERDDHTFLLCLKCREYTHKSCVPLSASYPGKMGFDSWICFACLTCQGECGYNAWQKPMIEWSLNRIDSFDVHDPHPICGFCLDHYKNAKNYCSICFKFYLPSEEERKKQQKDKREPATLLVAAAPQSPVDPAVGYDKEPFTNYYRVVDFYLNGGSFPSAEVLESSPQNGPPVGVRRRKRHGRKGSYKKGVSSEEDKGGDEIGDSDVEDFYEANGDKSMQANADSVNDVRGDNNITDKLTSSSQSKLTDDAVDVNQLRPAIAESIEQTDTYIDGATHGDGQDGVCVASLAEMIKDENVSLPHGSDEVTSSCAQSKREGEEEEGFGVDSSVVEAEEVIDGMVMCHECGAWVHALCEGIDIAQFEAIEAGTHPVWGDEYLCPGCRVNISKHVVDVLTELDTQEIFTEPVSEVVAKNYYDVIHNPMDLQTMMKKAKRGLYKSLQSLRQDWELMILNAMVFNTSGDFYYIESCRYHKRSLDVIVSNPRTTQMTAFGAEIESMLAALSPSLLQRIDNPALDPVPAALARTVKRKRSSNGSAMSSAAAVQPAMGHRKKPGTKPGTKLGPRGPKRSVSDPSRSSGDAQTVVSSKKRKKVQVVTDPASEEGLGIIGAVTVQALPPDTSNESMMQPLFNGVVSVIPVEHHSDVEAGKPNPMVDGAVMTADAGTALTAVTALPDGKCEGVGECNTAADSGTSDNVDEMNIEASVKRKRKRGNGSIATKSKKQSASSSLVSLDANKMASVIVSTSEGVVKKVKRVKKEVSAEDLEDSNRRRSGRAKAERVQAGFISHLEAVQLIGEMRKKGAKQASFSQLSSLSVSGEQQSANLADSELLQSPGGDPHLHALIVPSELAPSPAPPSYSSCFCAAVPAENAFFMCYLDSCISCGSSDATEYMLFCVDCGEAYHSFCVEAPISLMPFDARISWRCINCKICEICIDASEEDGQNLLYCESCDKMYHMHCLDPPLHETPSSKWFCSGCVSCVSCQNEGAALAVAPASPCWGITTQECWRCHSKITAVIKEEPADTVPSDGLSVEAEALPGTEPDVVLVPLTLEPHSEGSTEVALGPPSHCEGSIDVVSSAVVRALDISTSVNILHGSNHTGRADYTGVPVAAVVSVTAGKSQAVSTSGEDGADDWRMQCSGCNQFLLVQHFSTSPAFFPSDKAILTFGGITHFHTWGERADLRCNRCLDELSFESHLGTGVDAMKVLKSVTQIQRNRLSIFATDSWDKREGKTAMVNSEREHDRKMLEFVLRWACTRMRNFETACVSKQLCDKIVLNMKVMKAEAFPVWMYERAQRFITLWRYRSLHDSTETLHKQRQNFLSVGYGREGKPLSLESIMRVASMAAAFLIFTNRELRRDELPEADRVLREFALFQPTLLEFLAAPSSLPDTSSSSTRTKNGSGGGGGRGNIFEHICPILIPLLVPRGPSSAVQAEDEKAVIANMRNEQKQILIAYLNEMLRRVCSSPVVVGPSTIPANFVSGYSADVGSIVLSAGLLHRQSEPPHEMTLIAPNARLLTESSSPSANKAATESQHGLIVTSPSQAASGMPLYAQVLKRQLQLPTWRPWDENYGYIPTFQARNQTKPRNICTGIELLPEAPAPSLTKEEVPSSEKSVKVSKPRGRKKGAKSVTNGINVSIVSKSCLVAIDLFLPPSHLSSSSLSASSYPSSGIDSSLSEVSNYYVRSATLQKFRLPDAGSMSADELSREALLAWQAQFTREAGVVHKRVASMFAAEVKRQEDMLAAENETEASLATSALSADPPLFDAGARSHHSIISDSSEPLNTAPELLPVEIRRDDIVVGDASLEAVPTGVDATIIRETNEDSLPPTAVPPSEASDVPTTSLADMTDRVSERLLELKKLHKEKMQGSESLSGWTADTRPHAIPWRDVRRCCFCSESESDFLTGRLLMFSDGVTCHANCVRWSSEVVETNGILVDSVRARHRASRIFCFLCKTRGASIGCSCKRCRHSFHLRCAFLCKCAFFEAKLDTEDSSTRHSIHTILSCPEHVDEVCKDLRGRQWIPCDPPRQILLEQVAHGSQWTQTQDADGESARAAPAQSAVVANDGSSEVAQILSEKGNQWTARMGACSVLSLGSLRVDAPGFHSESLVYPPNFRSVRIFWSMKIPFKRTAYIFEVLTEGDLEEIIDLNTIPSPDQDIENVEISDFFFSSNIFLNSRDIRTDVRMEVEGYPIFRVAIGDAPDAVILSRSLDQAYSLIVRAVRACQLQMTPWLVGRKKRVTFGLTSPQFFGLSLPCVQAAMEAKPEILAALVCPAVGSFQIYRPMYFLPSVEIVHNVRRARALVLASRGRSSASGCARADGCDFIARRSEGTRLTRILTKSVGSTSRRGYRNGATENASEEGAVLDPNGEAPAYEAERMQQEYLLLAKAYLRNPRERVCVKRSFIHGWGLFARTSFAKNEMIIEYIGQKIRQVVADRREAQYEAEGVGSCYLFRLDAEFIVDATRRGGMARFINHCCAPSAHARVITTKKNMRTDSSSNSADDGNWFPDDSNEEDEKHIVIIATRHIEAGEEITYDYKFPIEENKLRCYCGAPQCSGSMN